MKQLTFYKSFLKNKNKRKNNGARQYIPPITFTACCLNSTSKNNDNFFAEQIDYFINNDIFVGARRVP